MKRVVLALYWVSLHLLPPRFRRRWGPEMLIEARDSLAESGPGLGRILAALRLNWDVWTTIVREWSSTVATAASASRGEPIMGPGILRDVRFATRSFLRTPFFSLLVVGTLGLGIGANTAIFSVLHAVVLKPLPYPEPDELVSVWPGKLFSLELLDAAREGAGSLSDISLFSGAVLTISEGSIPAELFGGEITSNHFRMMGVRPALGRDFSAEDGEPGATPVAILSHELWQRRFGGDPDIVGQSIALQYENAPRRTVIGVMPRGYRDVLDGAEAWIPVVEDRTADGYSGSSFAEAAGRLRPGTSLDAARREIIAVAQRIRDADPGQYSQAEVDRATVWPLVDRLAGSLRQNLFALLSAVVVVLLIASANVANLLLVRTSGRQREIGVRIAMGAGQGRLLRQFVCESVLLGMAGGLAGMVVAWTTQSLLLDALPSGFRIEETGLNGIVLAFTFAVALGASLLFGIAPALRAARRAPGSTLSGSPTTMGRGEWRIQSALVTGQMTLALVALFSAGLLVSSVRDLSTVDPGFDYEAALTFRVTAPSDEYPSDEDVLRFFREIEDAIGSIGAVTSVGAVGRLPLGGGTSRISFYPEGFEPDESGELPEATHRLVSAGYAQAAGFRLVEGRFPREAQFREGAQFGYVTRGLAERFFPEGAVGGRFIGPGGVPWLTITGVIEDVREDALHGPVLPGIYIPHRDWVWRTMYFVARTAGDPLALVDEVQSAVTNVAPSVPVSRVRTFEEVLSRSLDETRLTGRLFTLFGVLALVLGTVGVYGVMAYSLGRRRREFGIRLTLGAPRAELVRRAMQGALPPLLVGLGLGIAATVPVGRALASSLEAVRASNPAVVFGAATVLASVAAVATFVPVLRSTRVDPARSLRAD